MIEGCVSATHNKQLNLNRETTMTDLNQEFSKAIAREEEKTHYVGTYDNGSGYREFIDIPTPSREEAERSLGSACGMDEKVEECVYSQEYNCWITK
jgi:hypothetical protein